METTTAGSSRYCAVLDLSASSDFRCGEHRAQHDPGHSGGASAPMSYGSPWIDGPKLYRLNRHSLHIMLLCMFN